jgi:hypothetical protein
VEAIAFGAAVIATATGATGIMQEVCGEKLTIIPDKDWDSFTTAIVTTNTSAITPEAYYKYYYWENVVSNILPALAN